MGELASSGQQQPDLIPLDQRAVCSWPSEMRTCFELVLEDTDATSLFFGFFRLDRKGWLPVDVVDPNDKLERVKL